MLKTSVPAPATNIATISSAELWVGAQQDHRHADQRDAEHPVQQRPSRAAPGAGRRVIASRPADSAESTNPQPCSPIVSFATAGPSVKMAPMWMALRKPNASTTTHSQRALRKKSHPARRSASHRGLSLRTAPAAGICTPSSSAAATNHVIASNSTAHPAPTVTTSQRSTDGPMTIRLSRTSDIRALACWS